MAAGQGTRSSLPVLASYRRACRVRSPECPARPDTSGRDTSTDDEVLFDGVGRDLARVGLDERRGALTEPWLEEQPPDRTFDLGSRGVGIDGKPDARQSNVLSVDRLLAPKRETEERDATPFARRPMGTGIELHVAGAANLTDDVATDEELDRRSIQIGHVELVGGWQRLASSRLGAR